ncbi:hypothetical protein LTR82_013976 [Friedmanniomyces endolithicus]|uniref:Uncharacterized protein n=1 Tax=Friedmanniomyces endolithicus TaxID=329885 RepID=A0AAN6J3U2_9PEZI|nr:hypothetical protein LTR82_013976 [Friedmanniomyces endolithicus]
MELLQDPQVKGKDTCMNNNEYCSVLNKAKTSPVHTRAPLGGKRSVNLLDTVPEERIRAHCASIDRALATQGDNQSTEKTVCLFGAAPAALIYVIHRIAGKKETRDLHIKVHDMPLERVLAVWEATEVLGIRPAQPHIEGHVIGYISHYAITPEQMWVVAVASLHRRQSSKIFRTLIHQVAWNLVHQRYSEDGAQALQDKAREWPDLHFTIDKKVTELKEKKAIHDAHTLEYDQATLSPTDE